MPDTPDELDVLLANPKIKKVISRYLAALARRRAKKLGKDRCAEIASIAGSAAKAKRDADK